MPRPSRPARRVLAVLAAVAAAGSALVWCQPPSASAATTQTASCVDGGGVRWSVRVSWGAVYTASGVTKAALDSAGWTTVAARPVATDARVRTYDGTGTQLQDLRSTATTDYRSGTVFASRNPLNPPSAPGRARVVVSLGVSGDGFGSCSVTLTQPVPASPTPGPVTPTPTPAPSPSQPGSASDTYEADVVTATNAERAKAGLVPLSPQACVDSFAEAQAGRMAAEGQMYHQPLQPVLDACRLNRVGENVAYGYGSGTSVTAGWMASPGHRANILTSQFRLIGVGAAQAADGRWYSAQVFGTLAS